MNLYRENTAGTGSEWMGGRNLPLIISVCYFLCGCTWLVLGVLFLHGSIPEITEDILYVSVTSVLLYLLLARANRSIRAKESALRESEDRLARILI